MKTKIDAKVNAKVKTNRTNRANESDSMNKISVHLCKV